jgi:ketosteroid isomerase-like protein
MDFGSSRPVPERIRIATFGRNHDEMRTIAFGTLLLLASSCRQNEHQVSAFTSEDEAEIRAVLARQQEAWNRFDIDGFMEGYWHSDSLVFIGSSGVRGGWEATRERYIDTYGSSELMGVLQFDILSIRPLGSDHCLLTGRYQLTRKDDSPSGFFTLIFGRTAAGWKILYDHTS